MAVNRDTNRIEPLTQCTEHEMAETLAKLRGQAGDFHPGLLRPNGSPVPKTWSLFEMGELIVIKDYTFRVGYIGESAILLEPVGIVEVIAKPPEASKPQSLDEAMDETRALTRHSEASDEQ